MRTTIPEGRHNERGWRRRDDDKQLGEPAEGSALRVNQEVEAQL